MSFYFREKPRFGDKLRGKSGDELMQELKQQFEDNKPFFEPSTTRITRDPFERRSSFSRGFPFDDVEGFGRRGSDIRSHLDDLASRHPEFADHLLGSAWGDIPAFRNTNSLNRRHRRDSGGGSPSYQGHPDEDARSQTSGSSAASAASGASGVSSHGEPLNPSTNVFPEEQRDSSPKGNNNNNSRNTRRNPIPQYGLRNTVDIGQHRHEMDNNERMNDNRGQRSMSAPPENRQQEAPILGRDKHLENEQNSQNPNQRFVSRVDITPQFAQPSCNEKSGTKPQQQQSSNQQQKVPQQQSNVRHIPIFVEGRDEPVVPKNLEADETDSTGSWSYAKPQRTESPPHFQHPSQFSTPPQFQRPSHFNQHYRGGRARDWLPNFEEEFYSPQGTGFQHPGMRRHQQQPFTSQSPPHQPGQFRQPQQQEAKPSQRRNRESAYYNQPPPPPSATPQQKQPQQQQQQQEVAPEQPKKQKQPKDPLEKVAEVQKEVDSLNEQVIQWNGESRKDKTYMYLDEMLTRELIKLDDIETEGKENVRQARKNAIKSIQDSISLLESKAPLNDQRPAAQEAMEIPKEDAPEATLPLDNEESTKENNENIEDNNSVNVNEQQQTPIPLPAAPSSPSHEEPAPAIPEVDDSIAPIAAAETENIVVDETSSASEQPNNVEANVTSTVPTENHQTKPETEQQSSVIETTPAEPPEASVNVENAKSPKTTKKVRKTKKQQQQPTPITDSAIPLPAPISHALDAAK